MALERAPCLVNPPSTLSIHSTMSYGQAMNACKQGGKPADLGAFEVV